MGDDFIEGWWSDQEPQLTTVAAEGGLLYWEFIIVIMFDFLYVFVFIYNIYNKRYNIYNKRRLLVTVFMSIIALMVLSSAVFSRGYSGL